MGHAPERTILIGSPDEADTVEVPDTDNLVWISQTTLSVDETMETVRRLRERFPHLQDPPSDDICYATQNRQVAIKKVAPDADLVIVVGSANSSNSVRLVEVALEYGAKAAHRVDYASEIKQEWLDGVASVGVTRAERPFPRCWSQEVLADLADAGYGTRRGGAHRARGSDVLAAEGTAHRRFGQRRRARARRAHARLAFGVTTSPGRCRCASASSRANWQRASSTAPSPRSAGRSARSPSS